MKTLHWTLSSVQSAKQSSGVFAHADTVQMSKFHSIENWNLIYEAPYISVLLEDGSALVINIMQIAIPGELLL